MMNDEFAKLILDEIKGLNERFSGLEQRVGSIESRMPTKDDISSMVTKNDIANMATKEDVADLPYIRQAVTETSEKVRIMEKEIVRKEDLGYIHEKIAEHDRDIYQLKQHLF